MSEWVFAKDEMPEPNETIINEWGQTWKYYLIQDTYGDMYVARWNNYEWVPKGPFFGWTIDRREVVAWQELPEKCKEKEN